MRWIRPALALATLGLLGLATAGTAEAAITVANQSDSGPGSLRQAIAEAPPGETIVLPAGTYTLTSGALEIEKKSVTISGHGSGDTVIRSGGPFRVIQITGPLDATISGVTIRDGNVSSSVALGAGVLSLKSNLTLRDVTVTNNSANANGSAGIAGGVADGGGIVAADGRFSLIDSSVTNNTATAVGGSGAPGGVAVGGGAGVTGTVNILNSTVSGNNVDARGGQGPANAKQDGGVAVAGGLSAAKETSDPSYAIGVTISGNSADASGGPGGTATVAEAGGIFATSGEGKLFLANMTIASNVARGLNSSPGSVVAGGGTAASAGAPGSVEILGSTISGNRIEAEPGANLLGGNILANKGVSLANTIVAGGGGPPGAENCGGVDAVSLGFNIDSLDQCGFKAGGDQVNKDPLLGPLQLNGGPTQTMAPALGSPAIDQGKSFGSIADQRGVLRPIDLPTIPNSAAPGADGADVGAVEFQPSNALTLGKLTKNRKKGTAILSVGLPQPSLGTLTLGGKGLKTQAATIAGQAEVKLKVLGKGPVKKALRKRGKRKVQINVTYTPTGNSGATATRKAKLVRKHKKRRSHYSSR